MPIYNIRGINVDFPYDAYDSQVDYMDKVIQALQEVRFSTNFADFVKNFFNNRKRVKLIVHQNEI